MSWWPILALSVGAYACKATGVLLGAQLRRRDEREPSATAGGLLAAVVALLPAAVLAGLIVNETVGDGAAVTVDARLAGVVVGGLAAWRGAPFLVVIVVAAVVTAGLRALA